MILTINNICIIRLFLDIVSLFLEMIVLLWLCASMCTCKGSGAHLCAGGTFALYFLICRHAKVSLFPNRQPEAKKSQATNWMYPPANWEGLKRLKKHSGKQSSKNQTCVSSHCWNSMVMGDGILTPCISGLTLCPLHNIYIQTSYLHFHYLIFRQQQLKILLWFQSPNLTSTSSLLVATNSIIL